MKTKSLFVILYISILLMSIIGGSCINRPTAIANNDVFDVDSINYSNYMKHCADCHGDHLEKFRNKRNLYGKERSRLVSSIKKGTDDGMPSFEDGLKDTEISGLVDYLLLEITKEYEALRTKFPDTIVSEKQKFKLEVVVDGLKIPWGMAFLPTGKLLISEREGVLYLLNRDNELKEIGGLPNIMVKGQGGLMDIKLHPRYDETGWIYFSYSKPSEQDSLAGSTAVFRAKLKGEMLTDLEEVFCGSPDSKKGHHWGCRLAFDADGFLYLSVGDRGDRDNNPQSLKNACGKIHRIYDDGRIPDDNPFVDVEGAVSSIYSYGHRNPQGIDIHPETGEVWVHEHGPKGGDEINIIAPGKNYGWPVISYGINYNGTKFTNDTAKVGMEQPLLYWAPSIAPCGMTFVKGDKYPGWENSLFAGSLSFHFLKRCEVINDKVVAQENLLKDIGRVRNVIQGPDGYIYIAVEIPGVIYRLIPA